MMNEELTPIKIKISNEDILRYELGIINLSSFDLCLKYAENEIILEKYRELYIKSMVSLSSLTRELIAKYVNQTLLDQLIIAPVINTYDSTIQIISTIDNQEQTTKH